jgi:hypothetical protein
MQDAPVLDETTEQEPEEATKKAEPPRPPRKRRRRTGRISLMLVLTLVLLTLGVGLVALAFTGTKLRLPVWAVAEMEDRLNASLSGSRLPKGTALSVGTVEFAVDRRFIPEFHLTDVRLTEGAGRSVLTLPEAYAAFEPTALLTGKVHLSRLRLIGARMAAERDEAGRINFIFGELGAGPKSLGEVLDAAHAIFASPAFSSLDRVEAEGLTLTLSDARARRSWQVGDGRLLIQNGADTLTAELGMTLLDGAVSAQATLGLVSTKADGSARLTARINQIAAGDLAAFSPPLSWLSILRAPISGWLRAGISGEGNLEALEAELNIGAGDLLPNPDVNPIPLEKAQMKLVFDPKAARIKLSELFVESPSLRLRASGHSDLLAADGKALTPGALPDAFLGQFAFSEVMVDPEGLFQTPVRFSEGAVDMRLRLAPFRLDIGQLSLTEGDENVLLSAKIAEAEGGWKGGVDVALDRISTNRLIGLWPVRVVPRTRQWLEANVGQGTLFDVKAALRLTPEEPPRFSLGYEFADTEVRFVRTLPPIRDGRGHATVENNSYTIFLDKGHVISAEGGRVEADGSVFKVRDITQRPATAEVRLVTSSSLTAALSLLDQEPFRFLSKAGQPVDLGEGTANLVSDLTLPLKPRVTFPDVTYAVAGTVSDFRSDRLVPGRVIAVPEVEVRVDEGGMALSGEGTLGKLPFDVTYLQGFGLDQKGLARVNGDVRLSDTALRDLGVDLPKGMVKGEARAAVGVVLRKGEAPRLTLSSALVGMALRLDALGWSKAAKTDGTLDVKAQLGQTPLVESISIAASGLTAEGRITTRKGGGLDVARFSSVKSGDWFDASVDVTGNGKGRDVDIAVTGGTIDMRKMPENRGSGGAGGGGSPLSLALDRLVVSKGISFTDFKGKFSSDGGLNGQFSASMNGKGAINGAVAPARDGTAVRILSEDAGTIMAAAGIFDKGRGGTLDLTLNPRKTAGHYDGRAVFGALRVQGAPALASLLSAISVVGLLEQMNGAGLAFNKGEMSFILTPDAVQITQGSAVGASLGVSFAGLYTTAGGRLDLQGVISPIYLVNGIGAIFSRRGEGLFGFNYRLTGTADEPEVSVNPLSILTPGMFREIFRSAPPKLKDGG